jgi:hypothetical protein
MLLRRVDAVDLDEEVAGASQGRTLAVRRWVGDQSGVPQPMYEFGEGDLRLGTSQRGAEAIVDAAAEAQVLVVLTVGVEAVGIGDVGRVAAARGEHECDL